MKALTGDELRELYLKFFEEKGHKRLPGASLVPHNDPTLLLTGAGMVPFKPYFLGKEKPEYTRVTTCQRCVRLADVDSVGNNSRHGTFFEMLGNFSFGDYFKKEAIAWAWEFVTEHLELDQDRMWITVHLDDDEAEEIWGQIGIPAERIVRLGEDNFWEIGVGPCGPSSELHYDRGPEYGCGDPDCKPGCECDRYLEIWNLVFVQYHKDEAGEYHLLEQKSIDTGMGLERVACLLQNVDSIFDCDIVAPIVAKVAALAGVEYGKDPAIDKSIRVIADHSRSITFMALDGILPGNEGRGYVLRRLLRRIIRHGHLLGMEERFQSQVIDVVIKQMAPGYPELLEKREYIHKVLSMEEERFLGTLQQGTTLLEEIIASLEAAGEKEIPGDVAFRLYDTYGFPIELTKEIAEEHQLEVDEAGFNERMEQQRATARAARAKQGYLGDEKGSAYRELAAKYNVEFVGYDQMEMAAQVVSIIRDGQEVESAHQGERVEVVIDKTPFYAEGGGQVADNGTITAKGGAFTVESVSRESQGLIIHHGVVAAGTINVKEEVLATVYREDRMAAARNHTATHLLHQALKNVLGEHVNQAGSLVAPDRLRFDFTHFAAVTPEELAAIEAEVNAKILANLVVQADMMSYDEAIAQGATALFDEKYGDAVRVISIADYSQELCGGTHVRQTGEIGLLKILSEGAVAAGVRRIEAVTGKAALQHVAEGERILNQVAQELQTTPREVVEKLERLQLQIKQLERENASLQEKLAASSASELVERAETIDGLKVLVSEVTARDASALRTIGDQLKTKLGSGVIVLGSKVDDKVLFLAMVSPEAVDRGIHAGNIVREAAKVAGGGGGGRPDMAQAGGRNPEKLADSLQVAYQAVVNTVTH
ncbi:MAG: alanine--tRNA ligase [Firmicutes bacterium]|nr:alanine--tRNA ligase [Bacillota bacterium]